MFETLNVPENLNVPETLNMSARTGPGPGGERDPGETLTAAKALAWAAKELAAAGVPEPRREARYLLRLAGIALEEIIACPERPLSAPLQRRIGEILRRRAGREPLSRIAGEREFYGRVFHITSDVLDPRPDSETLIEAALEIVRERGWATASLRILDIGTGSGALLVTLLAGLPQAEGLGTDISPEALAVARENARRHGVADRARFKLCRSLEGMRETFDLIVANPPYIASGDIAGLAPEVRLWDPVVALDGGTDGLAIYREIIPKLDSVVPGGAALFETGAGQATAIRRLLSGKGAAETAGAEEYCIREWQDLAGHVRCIGVTLCNKRKDK